VLFPLFLFCVPFRLGQGQEKEMQKRGYSIGVGDAPILLYFRQTGRKGPVRMDLHKTIGRGDFEKRIANETILKIIRPQTDTKQTSRNQRGYAHKPEAFMRRS